MPDLDSDTGLDLLASALQDAYTDREPGWAHRETAEARRLGQLDALLLRVGSPAAPASPLLEGIFLARRRGEFSALCDAFVAGGLDGALDAARALVANLPPGLPRSAFRAHRGEWEEEVKRCGREREASEFALRFTGDALGKRLIVLRCQDGAMQRHFVGRIAAEELRRVGRLAPPPTDWRLPETGVRVDDRAAISGLAAAGLAEALAESDAAYHDFLAARPERGLRPAAPSLVLRATVSERAWRINPALTRHLLSEVARLASGWSPPAGASVELRVFLLLVHDDTGVDPDDRLATRWLWPLRQRRTHAFFADAEASVARTGAAFLTPWESELGPGERDAVTEWAEENEALLGVGPARDPGDDIRARIFEGHRQRRMSGVVNRLFDLRKGYLGGGA